jgi:hypothetical protein
MPREPSWRSSTTRWKDNSVALKQRISSAAASAAMDAVAGLLSGGMLELYDGAQPADADMEPIDQKILAALPLGTPAFLPADEGVASLAAPASGTVANTGEASWYRFRTSAGEVIEDGSVGTSGCNLNLSSVFLSAGAQLVIDSFALKQRKA